MTPADRLLSKAEKLLANATLALSVGLCEDAGRNAYLAGYSAARAFLFAAEGKLYKSHNGLQAEFARVSKDNPCFDREARSFLSQTFQLKKIADYEEGPESEISVERAAAALEAGKRFIACCVHAITKLHMAKGSQ